MKKLFPEKSCQLFINNDCTKLGGINIGKYPIQHFNELINSGNEHSPLYIYSSGFDDWKRGCYRFREKSNVFAFQLVESGSFIFVQNDKRYRVKPGEIFFVHKMQNSEMATEEDIAVKFAIIISGYLLQELLVETGLAAIDVLHPKALEKLKDLCVEINEFMMSRNCDLYANSILAYRLIMLLASETEKAQYPPELYGVISFMKNNIGVPLSIDDLLSKHNLSEPILYSLFKRYLNDTPMNYFIKLRVDTAANLLLRSSTPIKEIAEIVGYSNQLYFSSEFKRIKKDSPREFRNKYRFQ